MPDALGHLRLPGPARPARHDGAVGAPLHDHGRAPRDRGVDRGGERGSPGQPEQFLGVGHEHVGQPRAGQHGRWIGGDLVQADIDGDPDTQVARFLHEPGHAPVGVQVAPGRPLLAQDLQPALVLADLGLGARRQVADERPVSRVVHHHRDASGGTGDALRGR